MEMDGDGDVAVDVDVHRGVGYGDAVVCAVCCVQDDAVVMQGGMSVVLLHFHCTIVLLSIAVVSVVSTGQDRSTEAVLSRVLAVLLLCCVLHCNCDNVSQATGYVIYPAAVHHTPAYCRILGSALLCKFWSAAT